MYIGRIENQANPESHLENSASLHRLFQLVSRCIVVHVRGGNCWICNLCDRIHRRPSFCRCRRASCSSKNSATSFLPNSLERWAHDLCERHVLRSAECAREIKESEVEVAVIGVRDMREHGGPLFFCESHEAQWRDKR